MTLRNDPELAREIYIRAVTHGTITSIRDAPTYYENREILRDMAKASFIASEEFNRVCDTVTFDYEDRLRIDRERKALAEVVENRLRDASATE